jgi:hypothetical protein
MRPCPFWLQESPLMFTDIGFGAGALKGTVEPPSLDALDAPPSLLSEGAEAMRSQRHFRDTLWQALLAAQRTCTRHLYWRSQTARFLSLTYHTEAFLFRRSNYLASMQGHAQFSNPPNRKSPPTMCVTLRK